MNTTTHTRSIDLDAIAQFRELAQHLNKAGHWGHLWVKGPGDKKTTRWYRTEPYTALDTALENLPTSADVYFGVYPVRADAETTPHTRSKKEDVAALNCLFREYDVSPLTGKGDLRAHIEGLEKPPSAVIETPGGFHAYWLFLAPEIIDPAHLDHYVDAVAGWVMMDELADHGAKDLARVLRVPGTYNQKPKYDEADRLITWVRWQPDRLYAPKTLLRLGKDHYDKARENERAASANARGVVMPRKLTDNARLDAYVETILDDVNQVARAPQGQRTTLLFKVAARLGNVVGAGALDVSVARQRLLSAAAANGLLAEDGQANIEKQIDNGLARGQSTPLNLAKFEDYELSPNGVTVDSPPVETSEPSANGADALFNPLSSERAILSVLLNNGALYDDVADRYGLRPAHFYHVRHQVVLDAFRQVALYGTPDRQSVEDRLHVSGWLNRIGGRATLDALQTAPGSDVSLETYIERILSAYTRREAKALGSAVGEVATNTALDADGVVSRIQELAGRVHTPRSRRRLRTASDAAGRAYDDIVAAMDGGDDGDSTGLANLDRYGTLRPKELILLAGRPNMGKTAMQLHLAYTLARAGKKVGLISMEMDESRLIYRMAAAAQNIPAGHFPTLSPPEFKGFTDFMAGLGKLDLWIDDTPGLTPSEIIAWARRASLEQGLDYLLVDHIGLPNYRAATQYDKREAMGDFALRLRDFAKSYECTVIAAMQLSRACEQRADKRPLLSDLGDSDLPGQHADRAWMLYRDSYYDIAEPGQESLMEVLVRKNRHNATGTALVDYDRRYQKITDTDMQVLELN